MNDAAPSVRELYVWDHARLWRALFAASGSLQTTHDTMVEVFAVALRRAPAGEDPTDLVWSAAFTIATQAEFSQNEPTGTGPATDATIDDTVSRIATLGAEDRTLVAWRHVAGWSPEELAPAVRSSRRALRRRLEGVDERARDAGVFDNGDPEAVFAALVVPDVWDEVVVAAAALPEEEPQRRGWRR